MVDLKKIGWKKIAKPNEFLSLNGSRIYADRWVLYKVFLYRSLSLRKYYVIEVRDVTYVGARVKSRWIRSAKGISRSEAGKVFTDITYRDIR